MSTLGVSLPDSGLRSPRQTPWDSVSEGVSLQGHLPIPPLGFSSGLRPPCVLLILVSGFEVRCPLITKLHPTSFRKIVHVSPQPHVSLLAAKNSPRLSVQVYFYTQVSLAEPCSGAQAGRAHLPPRRSARPVFRLLFPPSQGPHCPVEHLPGEAHCRWRAWSSREKNPWWLLPGMLSSGLHLWAQ